MLKRVPARQSSEFAIEGTKAHEVLQVALENGCRNAKQAHEEFSTYFYEELDSGDNQFYFAVQVALNHIYAIIDANPDAVMWIETYVNPPTPNAPGEAAGYCDVCIWLPGAFELHVIDYKHGAGVAKDVQGNPQPLLYAGGFLFEERAMIDANAVGEVVLTIIQPRAFHKDGPIREHVVTPNDVWEYLQQYNAVIGEAEKPDAPLTPGVTQCRFCDAATVCPAREAQALAPLAVAGAALQDYTGLRNFTVPLVSDLTLDRLATIRKHAPVLRRWLDDVENYCYELARAGHSIPGAKLVEAAPKRRYYGDPKDVARKLAAMIGAGDATEAMNAYDSIMQRYPVLNAIFSQRLIPLTHAEKLVVEAYRQRVGRGKKKKAAENANHDFAYLTLKESSGSVTLVDEDDERPAVNKATSAFSQITGVLALNSQEQT